MTHEERVRYYWDQVMRLKEPQEESLGSIVEKNAQSFPNVTFIHFAEQRLTWQEFNSGANRYANFFSGQGFVKGDVIALMMENSPQCLMAVAGLSKIGVIAAMINPGIRGEVLEHDINLAEPRAVLVDSESWAPFSVISERLRLKSPARILAVKTLPDVSLPPDMEDLTSLLPAARPDNPDNARHVISSDILAYLYTAGNSGLRKAVPVSHKRWLKAGYLTALYGGLSENSVLYMAVPVYLNSGFNVCLSGAVISGAGLLLKRSFSASRFLSDVRSHRVTHLVSVDEMCRYIARQPEKPDDADNPLECVISNGLAPDLFDVFYNRFGVRHIYEIYGTTEGVGVFINLDEIPGMCGCLNLEGMRQGEVVRYDVEQNQLILNEQGWAIKCQPGETGMLVAQINELNEFAGYVNDPETTQMKTLRDLFAPGDVYYRTDDLVKLHANDYIAFVDRLGETYRFKGKTVSASAVADVLTKFFGGIEEAVAYGVKLPGHEGRCGMAALKMIEGEKLDWAKFTSHINNRMPEHARPVFIRICTDRQLDLEQAKRRLQLEGYNPAVVKDPLFYYHEKKGAYVPLTVEAYQLITEGGIAF